MICRYTSSAQARFVPINYETVPYGGRSAPSLREEEEEERLSDVMSLPLCNQSRTHTSINTQANQNGEK